jgi:hypothetical protein
MAAGNVGLLDANSITIISKTSSVSEAFDKFKSSVEKDIRYSVPVNNRVYPLPLSELPTNLTSNQLSR